MSIPTEKQLAGHHRRSLRSIRTKLLAMSEAWDGVDQFNMSELEQLADKCEEVAASMVTGEPDQAGSPHDQG